MLRSRQIALFVVCAVLVVLSVPAGLCMGATRTWTGTIDNDWYGTGNWDPTGDPDRADVLYVYSGSPTTTSNVTTDYGGSITLDGSAAVADFSSRLYIAYSTNVSGRLDVLNGGTVSNTYGYLGYGSGASGTATVSGAGSAWNNSGILYVGGYGTGALSITDGGTVSNTDGCLGRWSSASGTATVSGAGSTWNNSSNIYVGVYGTGALSITGGGTVSNTDGCVGFDGSGEVEVSGAGSTWTNSGSMYVGGDSTNAGGTGSVTVRDGGYLEVGGTLRVWAPGAIDIGGTGRITVSKKLSFAQDSRLTAEGGAVIHMTGSAFENESTNAANLGGLGNLTMIFEGGTGDVDPFEAAGEDVGAVMGGFVESNFVLGALQIGGVDVGRIQLVDDFDNQDDGSLGNEALYVETLTIDSGSCVDLNGLNLYFKKDGNAKKLYQGDADVDGQVADSDLSLLLSNWQQSGGWPEGDFNCDGAVTDADLSLLLSNWQAGVGGPASDVPEPATLTLFALGALAVLKRRRRPRA